MFPGNQTSPGLQRYKTFFFDAGNKSLLAIPPNLWQKLHGQVCKHNASFFYWQRLEKTDTVKSHTDFAQFWLNNLHFHMIKCALVHVKMYQKTAWNGILCCLVITVFYSSIDLFFVRVLGARTKVFNYLFHVGNSFFCISLQKILYIVVYK